MPNKTCYIFAAGEYGELAIDPAELTGGLVIAADAGYLYLRRRGIVPHMVVGDFDSMPDLWREPTGTPAGTAAPPGQPRIVRHPVMKDETDTMLAVREGLQQGCTQFMIYGGLGGRLDHAYANLQILPYLARRGAIGFLAGSGMAATAIHNARLRFDRSCSGTLSVFCAGGPARGVCLSGLLYPLQDAELSWHNPTLGVSNEFTGQPVEVLVKQGTLLVFWTHRDPLTRDMLPQWQPYQP